jgi:two-component system chemotaxis response regulator CheY
MTRTVLVSDSHAEDRDQLAWCLRVAGYKVIAARNGFEAMEALWGNKIDLVLLEPDMRDPGGQLVLAQMAADPRFQRTPVISLGGGLEAPRELAVLPKPFTTERVIEMAQAIIGASRHPVADRETPSRLRSRDPSDA